MNYFVKQFISKNINMLPTVINTHIKNGFVNDISYDTKQEKANIKIYNDRDELYSFDVKASNVPGGLYVSIVCKLVNRDLSEVLKFKKYEVIPISITTIKNKKHGIETIHENKNYLEAILLKYKSLLEKINIFIDIGGIDNEIK